MLTDTSQTPLSPLSSRCRSISGAALGGGLAWLTSTRIGKPGRDAASQQVVVNADTMRNRKHSAVNTDAK